MIIFSITKKKLLWVLRIGFLVLILAWALPLGYNWLAERGAMADYARSEEERMPGEPMRVDAEVKLENNGDNANSEGTSEDAKTSPNAVLDNSNAERNSEEKTNTEEKTNAEANPNTDGSPNAEENPSTEENSNTGETSGASGKGESFWESLQRMVYGEDLIIEVPAR